ncbi:Acyltransferase [Pseudomonas marincola]|uniref:Glycosyl transferase n=1 Tax=Pseudomonas marincola TaxID=437900 RepID=A0A653E0R0_9PSED|nr:glycosyl transferase [Pseudomonas marincola]CAE6948576.1 Acyltransferase [Pseudomonas marincola]
MSRPDNDQHWAAQQERGSLWMMKFTVVATRTLGRRLISPLLYLIVLYFFIFGAKARRSIRQYQLNLMNWSGKTPPPSLRSVFAQFMAFADALLDKLDIWRGKLSARDIDLIDPHNLRGQMHAPRGQMLVGAHLGNLEVCRALAELGDKVTMNVLVHTKHAEQFNQLLGEAGARNMRLIQVSELNPATMLQLSERIERGEWLAIAGDRIPLHGGRQVTVDFLSKPAAFPQGPWLLAGLLDCPVNLLSCVKIAGRYQILLEPFATRVQWKRSNRDAVIREWTQRFADRLAERCLDAPQQWFNFYPFWNSDDDTSA